MFSALLLSALTFVLCWFAVPVFVPDSFSDAADRNFSLAVATVLSIALCFSTLWWSNLRVQVTPDQVEVWRPGQLVHRWSRHDTVFTTSVTKQYYNGVRSGAVRSLVAHTPFGEQAVGLGTMTRETFNELYSVLERSPGQQAAHVPGQAPGWVQTPDGGWVVAPTPAAPMQPRQFLTHKDVLARRMVPMLVIGALLTVVGVGSLVALFQADDFNPTFAYVGIAVLPGLVLLIVGAVGAARERKRPRQVVVTPQELIVGEVRHDLSQVQRIWLSPASYAERSLRVVGANGKKHQYDFGSGAVKPDKQVLPEWDELILTLQQATQARPGMVALDLG